MAKPNPFFFPPSNLLQCMPDVTDNFRDYGTRNIGYQRYVRVYHRENHSTWADIPAQDDDQFRSALLEIQSANPLGDREEGRALLALTSPYLVPTVADFANLQITSKPIFFDIPYEHNVVARVLTAADQRLYYDTLLSRFYNETMSNPAFDSFVLAAAEEVAMAVKCGVPIITHNFGGSVMAFVLRLLHHKMEFLGIDQSYWTGCRAGYGCWDAADQVIRDCDDGDPATPWNDGLQPTCGNGYCEQGEDCNSCPGDCDEYRTGIIHFESSVSADTQRALRAMATFKRADGKSRIHQVNIASVMRTEAWNGLKQLFQLVPGDQAPDEDTDYAHAFYYYDVTAEDLDYWLAGDIGPRPDDDPGLNNGLDFSCTEVGLNDIKNAHFSLIGQWLYQGHFNLDVTFPAD